MHISASRVFPPPVTTDTIPRHPRANQASNARRCQSRGSNWGTNSTGRHAIRGGARLVGPTHSLSAPQAGLGGHPPLCAVMRLGQLPTNWEERRVVDLDGRPAIRAGMDGISNLRHVIQQTSITCVRNRNLGARDPVACLVNRSWGKRHPDYHRLETLVPVVRRVHREPEAGHCGRQHEDVSSDPHASGVARHLRAVNADGQPVDPGPTHAGTVPSAADVLGLRRARLRSS